MELLALVLTDKGYNTHLTKRWVGFHHIGPRSREGPTVELRDLVTTVVGDEDGTSVGRHIEVGLKRVV
jgi:hypothetical protein